MNGEKVLVAMSGGVDSSVAAALLLKQGYDVAGATMKLYGSGDETAEKDAARVAEILGIDHYIFDFREIFKKTVIKNFLDEYSKARTPNPCVLCNRRIKFSAFYEKAAELGANFIATGHYARVESRGDGFHLMKGLDAKKDQSYVLYHLNQERMAHFLLPLGGYTKEEIRGIANEISLPVAGKSESQDICFIPDGNHTAYLRKFRPDAFCPGNIVDGSGKILGGHEGLPLYTVGQRKGLGIAAPAPLYVIGIDGEKNEVIVGYENQVFFKNLFAEDLTWTRGAPEEKFHASVKVRYGRREESAEITPIDERKAKVVFEKSMRAVTPGQAAVFYDGDEVIGGGVIESAELYKSGFTSL